MKDEFDAVLEYGFDIEQHILIHLRTRAPMTITIKDKVITGIVAACDRDITGKKLLVKMRKAYAV